MWDWGQTWDSPLWVRSLFPSQNLGKGMKKLPWDLETKGIKYIKPKIYAYKIETWRNCTEMWVSRATEKSLSSGNSNLQQQMWPVALHPAAHICPFPDVCPFTFFGEGGEKHHYSHNWEQNSNCQRINLGKALWNKSGDNWSDVMVKLWNY